MRDVDTYQEAGWDFVGEVENGVEEIWWIEYGQGYPRLWRELADTDRSESVTGQK